MALFIIALLLGALGSFGLAYIVYQPQIQKLQDDLHGDVTSIQNHLSYLNYSLNTINSSLGNLQSSIRPSNREFDYLMAPKAVATFDPPSGKLVDIMLVWAAEFEDSTYGSFKMAMYGYESYDYADGNLVMIHDEYHWFTDNWLAGKTYAELAKIVYPSSDGVPIEYVSNDVTIARIDITTLEHQLNVTVINKGTTVFTAAFWANATAPLQTRIEPGSPLPPDLFLSVEADRPILKVLVTVIEVGNFQSGRFDYIDAELYDSSLLQ